MTRPKAIGFPAPKKEALRPTLHGAFIGTRSSNERTHAIGAKCRSMKILEPKQFSKEDINGMRETLHESEWEGLKDRDLRLILWEGCVGWENMPDEEVVEHYQNIYGETDNVEIVTCDKELREQHGHIIARFNDIK